MLEEHEFPVSIADSDKLAVVIEVNETLSLHMILLAGEVGQLIVAVDMHLVGALADLPFMSASPISQLNFSA